MLSDPEGSPTHTRELSDSAGDRLPRGPEDPSLVPVAGADVETRPESVRPALAVPAAPPFLSLQLPPPTHPPVPIEAETRGRPRVTRARHLPLIIP